MTEENNNSGYKLPLLETIIAIVLFIFLSVPIIRLYVGADKTRSSAVGISEAMIHVENLAELMHSKNCMRTSEGYVFFGSDGAILALAEGTTTFCYDGEWNLTDHEHADYCITILSNAIPGSSGYLIKATITASDAQGNQLAQLESAGTIFND